MDWQPSEKQLMRTVDDSLEKERTLWKALELNSNDTKSRCGVTYEHRSDVIEWIFQVSSKFQFYPEAQALAVSILDKFLATVKVQMKYLKCVSLACLYIACKLTEEDERVPHVADLVTQSSANCSTDDIVRMERLILNKLNWNVYLATPLHFLQVCHAYLMTQCPDLLSSVHHMNPSLQRAILTHKLEICMTSAEACQWSPAIIAVSLLSLELEQFRPDWFPLTLTLLKFIKRVNFSELIGCKERLSAHLIAVTLAAREQAAFREHVEVSSRQHKRTRHHTNVSNKRKMTELPPDQDDIYASIKGLYNEEDREEIPDPSAIAAAIGNEM